MLLNDNVLMSIGHLDHILIVYSSVEHMTWKVETQDGGGDFENVSNSELDRAICTKFGGEMHRGHAEMTHDQKSKLEVYSRDVIKQMSGT